MRKKKTSRSSKPKVQAATAPLKAITQKQTKSQVYKKIAEDTGLSLKQVKTVFQAASYIAKCSLIKRGYGAFSIPEMDVKLVRKTKPATKPRVGRNPKTGEEITIAAKPKRDVIKVRALKALKNLVLVG